MYLHVYTCKPKIATKNIFSAKLYKTKQNNFFLISHSIYYPPPLSKNYKTSMDSSQQSSSSLFSRGKSYLIGSLGSLNRNNNQRHSTSDSKHLNSIENGNSKMKKEQDDDAMDEDNNQYISAFSGCEHLSTSKQQRYSQAISYNSKHMKEKFQYSNLNSNENNKIEFENNEMKQLFQHHHKKVAEYSPAEDKDEDGDENMKEFKKNNNSSTMVSTFQNPSFQYLQHDSSDSLLESLIKLDLGNNNCLLFWLLLKLVLLFLFPFTLKNKSFNSCLYFPFFLSFFLFSLPLPLVKKKYTYTYITNNIHNNNTYI